jgi:hypothetical protein
MIIAMNLNTTMKRLVLGAEWAARRMKAIRMHLIALPGQVTHARQLIVRLGRHPSNDLLIAFVKASSRSWRCPPNKPPSRIPSGLVFATAVPHGTRLASARPRSDRLLRRVAAGRTRKRGPIAPFRRLNVGKERVTELCFAAVRTEADDCGP